MKPAEDPVLLRWSLPTTPFTLAETVILPPSPPEPPLVRGSDPEVPAIRLDELRETVTRKRG